MKSQILLLFGFFIFLSFETACQHKPVTVTPSSNIQPIAAIKNHYKTLQELKQNVISFNNASLGIVLRVVKFGTGNYLPTAVHGNQWFLYLPRNDLRYEIS